MLPQNKPDRIRILFDDQEADSPGHYVEKLSVEPSPVTTRGPNALTRWVTGRVLLIRRHVLRLL